MRSATVIAVLLLLVVTARAEERRAPSWARTDNDVVVQLEGRNVGEWARDLETGALPADADGLFLRLSVLLRAGHHAGLELLFAALGRLPREVQRSEVSSAAGSLILRGEWDLVRRLFERVPHATPHHGETMFSAWDATVSTAQIDAWLAARAKADIDAWFGARVQFLERAKALGPFVLELADNVRQSPADLPTARRFLHAQARLDLAADVSWLADVCRPRLAYDAFAFAQALQRPAWQATALLFLDRALELPFTSADEAAIRSSWSIASQSEEEKTLERLFHGSVKHAMMRAYHTVGDAARAQVLLEELTRDYPEGIPSGSLGELAGGIQAASGARVIEKRILEAEGAKTEDAAYWLSRAQYYVGRAERAAADAAFDRALALLGSPGNEPEPRRAGPSRIEAVRGYAHWLWGSERGASATSMLWRELELARPGGGYAKALLAEFLWDPDRQLPNPDDERLWRHLSAREAWSHGEERLLARMAGEKTSEAFLDRAGALSQGRHPSRPMVLGTVLKRRGALRRALPLLEDAVERLSEERDRESTAFTLFEVVLALGEWKAAESAWPGARARLSASERPDWLGRIALAAARAGAPGEALRLWAQRTNLDRSDEGQLEDLSRAGLRDRLIAFYERMAVLDPASVYPARFLALLHTMR